MLLFVITIISDLARRCEVVNLDANLCDFFGFCPVYLNFNRHDIRPVKYVQHMAVYNISGIVRYIEKCKGAYLLVCLSAPTKSEDEVMKLTELDILSHLTHLKHLKNNKERTFFHVCDFPGQRSNRD